MQANFYMKTLQQSKFLYLLLKKIQNMTNRRKTSNR